MGIQLPERLSYDIVLVGAGATGSHLLSFLTQLAANFTASEVRIRIVDADVVEEKNLLNQKFLAEDVSHLKAEVLCERYQSAYPELDISYLDAYVTEKESFVAYLRQANDRRNVLPILVSCVDNNATRKVFDDVFYDDRIPGLIYIDAGNGTVQRVGQVVVGYKSSEAKQVPDHQGTYNAFCMGNVSTGVVLLPAADVFPEIRAEEQTVTQSVSCGASLNEHPQNIATNIMSALTVFAVLNNILAFNQITSHISYFDAENLQLTTRLPQETEMVAN